MRSIFATILVFSLFGAVQSDEKIGVRTFLHIPKTGGTTFRHIFSDDCTSKGMNSFVFMSQMVVNNTKNVEQIKALILEDKVRCLYGHLSWAVLKQVQTENPRIVFDIFLMLREPVPRAISHYVYNMKARNETWSYMMFFEEYSNHITNYLHDSKLSIETILFSHIHYIGLTEYFHETLAYLYAIRYLGNRDSIINSKSRKVVSEKVITDEMWEAASMQNIIDQEVYQLAVDIFLEQLDSMTEEQNAIYSDIVTEIYENNHDCEDDDVNVGSGKCW